MKRIVVIVVAISMLFAGTPTQTDAGVIAGVATEWTQILNHVQLIQSYIRQGLQLENELKDYQLASRASNCRPNKPSLPHCVHNQRGPGARFKQSRWGIRLQSNRSNS